ncbi:hypothetical protein R3P38DRAFT_517995 [Favolaschia claudopus]|uniref:Uncharacterized protein n=1 Tax=Favolaschia claudopus TaxID=2862362 RepID=A0AAV9ZBK7_9AGAR
MSTAPADHFASPQTRNLRRDRSVTVPSGRHALRCQHAVKACLLGGATMEFGDVVLLRPRPRPTLVVAPDFLAASTSPPSAYWVFSPALAWLRPPQPFSSVLSSVAFARRLSTSLMEGRFGWVFIVSRISPTRFAARTPSTWPNEVGHLPTRRFKYTCPFGHGFICPGRARRSARPRSYSSMASRPRSSPASFSRPHRTRPHSLPPKKIIL